MEKDLLEKAKLNSLVERINVVKKEELNHYYILEDICLFSYDRESMRGLELSLVKESGGDILNIPNINGFKLTSRTGCFDILIIGVGSSIYLVPTKYLDDNNTLVIGN